MAARRVPATIWAAWAFAVAALAILTVAVLNRPTGQSHMDMLFRGNSVPNGPLLSSRLFTTWHLDAVAVAVLVLLAVAYWIGLELRARRTAEPWPLARTVSFGLGLGVIGYATCGAVAVYDQALFTAHMLGHLALVMLAPALLVCGGPLRLALEASGSDRLKRAVQGRVASFVTAPPVALASYIAVIVGSHLTGLMNDIMRITWAGQLEHLVYLLVGYQFFCVLVGDEPIRWRLSTPARWTLLAVSMAVDTFTGIVLMMSSVAIAMYSPPGLHVDQLSDTHTGGAIMWFGGDFLMMVIMVALAIGWLRTSGRSSRDRISWFEQARVATLSDKAGMSETDLDIDEDDVRLAAYNEWLAARAR